MTWWLRACLQCRWYRAFSQLKALSSLPPAGATTPSLKTAAQGRPSESLAVLEGQVNRKYKNVHAHDSVLLGWCYRLESGLLKVGELLKVGNEGKMC